MVGAVNPPELPQKKNAAAALRSGFPWRCSSNSPATSKLLYNTDFLRFQSFSRRCHLLEHWHFVYIRCQSVHNLIPELKSRSYSFPRILQSSLLFYKILRAALFCRRGPPICSLPLRSSRVFLVAGQAFARTRSRYSSSSLSSLSTTRRSFSDLFNTPKIEHPSR